MSTHKNTLVERKLSLKPSIVIELRFNICDICDSLLFLIDRFVWLIERFLKSKLRSFRNNADILFLFRLSYQGFGTSLRLG